MPVAPTAVHGGNSISRVISVFGVGYIVISAFGLLVFLSAIVLAFCVCYRAFVSHRRTEASDFELPRVIFASDEEDRRSSEGMEVGLDRSVINSLQKFRFEKLKENSESAAELCAICLCEFRDEEIVRMMPDCGHYFHLLCIDEWLLLSGSCPVCRSSPLLTPLSTPLSEGC